MLADFYIPSLLNDMKIAVQKNHLVGQILFKFGQVWSLLKKRLHCFFTHFRQK